MRRIRWTPNRALAAAALLLGVVALAGSPQRGHTVPVNTQTLAAEVAGEVDHVTPAELGDWIVQGRTDYRLIDLRGETEYAAYHIPTAEHVPLARLMEHGLLRNEKIVLASEGGIHSAQAWFLLRAERYPGVYILRGGIEGWKDEVLFPVMPADSSARARAAFERTAQVARFFGGGPRAAGAATAEVVLPAPAAPGAGMAAPRLPSLPQGAGPGRAKKKKEGC